MAEIINLRRARKARQRRDAEEVAAQNRVTHGLTKAEKAAAKAQQKSAKKDLDGKVLDDPAAN